MVLLFFFFSSRRRHTRFKCDWSSDVCSSDLVGVEKKNEDGTKTLDLVPPNRPPTVLDLMRQTSGITYGFYGDSLVRKAYAAANLYAGDFDLAEFADRIPNLPLHHHPRSLRQY